MRIAIVILLGAAALPAIAQFSQEQKVFEFQALASVYVRHYAPYEWKRDTLKFDAFDLKPWLDEIRAGKDDLSFYEVCARYVSRLDDAHSTFRMPSNFSATLGFSSDIYDGKVIVDSITRSRLPLSRYPFQIGDEVVSIDGKPVAELLAYIKQFTSGGNARSANRVAAARLTSRSQFWLPRAHEIGEEAVLEIRRRENGDVETYRVPWQKSGTPVTVVGPVPSPGKLGASRSMETDGEQPDVPEYMRPLEDLARFEDPSAPMILNYGVLQPVWRFPQGFQQRLGRTSSDFFISGSFTAADADKEKRIGLLRIPHFVPSSTANAIRQFETEIAWMQENTDGLVIDVMRNNGGNGCYTEELLRRLIPYQFRGLAVEIRATRSWINNFSASLELAKLQRAEPHVIALLGALLKDVTTAYSEARGRTGAIPTCATTLERQPANVSYKKPVMLLIDEFSTSAADLFPALFQDARRGPLFGTRTQGAGGAVRPFRFGIFAEATTSVTISLLHRAQPIVTSDYPTEVYIENIGVRPDTEYDYMTVENLLSGGRQFVDAFTAAMVEHIRRSQ